MQDRIAYGTFHGFDPDRKGPNGYKLVPAAASSAPASGRPAPSGPRRVKRRRSDDDGPGGEDDDDDDEVGYTANRSAHACVKLCATKNTHTWHP
jgi:hypothetical protein